MLASGKKPEGSDFDASKFEQTERYIADGLSVSDAARRTGIDETTFYRWRRESGRSTSGRADDKVVNLKKTDARTEHRVSEPAKDNGSVPTVSGVCSGVSDTLIRCDAQGRYLDVVILAPADEQNLQAQEELLGRRVDEVLPGEPGRLIAGAIQEALRTGVSRVVEYPLPSPAGRLWFEARTTPVGDDELRVHIIDITARKRAELDLRRRLGFERLVSDIAVRFMAPHRDRMDEHLDYALRTVGEFFDLDRAYVFMAVEDDREAVMTHEWCNEGVAPQVGAMKEFRLDQLPWFRERIKRGETVNVPDVAALGLEAMREKELFSAQDIRSLLCIPLEVDNGTLLGFMGYDAVRARCVWTAELVSKLEVIAGVTSGALSRRRMEEQLRHRTYHDPLTDLYNRTFFEEEIRRLDVERQLPLSVIMADIDGLKRVNDMHGYGRGDDLLRRAGGILRFCCREEDIVARWGGDEFVILLPQTDSELAGRICKRMHERCAGTRSALLPVSFGLGHATKERMEEGIESVLRTASQRMQREKRGNRNTRS